MLFAKPSGLALCNLLHKHGRFLLLKRKLKAKSIPSLDTNRRFTERKGFGRGLIPLLKLSSTSKIDFSTTGPSKTGQ